MNLEAIEFEELNRKRKENTFKKLKTFTPY